MQIKDELIYDDGKLRGCAHNRARMTYWQVFYHSWVTWGGFKSRFINLKDVFIELLSNIWDLVICITDIPLWIILSPIVVYRRWKKAKLTVEKEVNP